MPRTRLLIVTAFVLYVALMLFEKVQSGEAFTWLGLVADLAELGLLAAAVWFTATLSFQSQLMKIERRDLIRDLTQARSEGEHWRRAARGHVEGLSRAIAEQFLAWHLTEAEADVAGLMLKGLTHKEIAALRGNSEATVRQHAATVYRKSGLSSRAQLTAFFLEDLLPPGRPAATAGGNDGSAAGTGTVTHLPGTHRRG